MMLLLIVSFNRQFCSHSKNDPQYKIWYPIILTAQCVSFYPHSALAGGWGITNVLQRGCFVNPEIKAAKRFYISAIAVRTKLCRLCSVLQQMHLSLLICSLECIKDLKKSSCIMHLRCLKLFGESFFVV